MDTINIIGHNNLMRDLNSKAILNTDPGAIQRYNQQSKIVEDAKLKTDEIQQIKDDMEMIKSCLIHIFNKLDERKN